MERRFVAGAVPFPQPAGIHGWKAAYEPVEPAAGPVRQVPRAMNPADHGAENDRALAAMLGIATVAGLGFWTALFIAIF